MTQYVLQIIDETQQLIKCYEVTDEAPVRGTIPAGRTQAVITDGTVFNEAVAAYEQHGANAHYSWDGANLSWEIV
jgi:hypothetical protein